MSLKIEYRVVGGAGSYATLADTSDVLEEFAPDVVVTSVQKTPLAQAIGQLGPEFRAALGNVVTRFNWKITKSYADETTGSAGARTITLALLGSKNNLKVTKGTDIEYYPNAVCSQCSHVNGGGSIEFRIILEADLVQPLEPA